MALVLDRPKPCMSRHQVSTPPGMSAIARPWQSLRRHAVGLHAPAMQPQSSCRMSPRAHSIDCEATPPRRIAIFVEPSPFTYVCGYANRFTNTIRCLVEQGCEVLVITTGTLPYQRSFGCGSAPCPPLRHGRHPPWHPRRRLCCTTCRLPWRTCRWGAIAWVPPVLGHAHLPRPLAPRVCHPTVPLGCFLKKMHHNTHMFASCVVGHH